MHAHRTRAAAPAFRAAIEAKAAPTAGLDMDERVRPDFLDPLLFHVANVLLHALASTLVCG